MPSAPDAPLIDCHAGLAALPPAFCALFGARLFDSWPWYAASCATALPPSAEALFISVTAGHRPLALFPLRRDITRIASLTTPYTGLWRPLLAPGLTAAELHGAGRAFGRWCRNWAVVRLDGLDPNDPVWPVLLDGMRDSGIRPLPYDHFGNWTAFAGLGWGAYLAGRPSDLREALDRRGKQLLAAGATFRAVTGGADLEPGIRAYGEVHGARWRQAEPFPAFDATLMRACAAEGWLRLGLLEQGGHTLAAQFWVVQGGGATMLSVALGDSLGESLYEASPGTVLTGWMIRYLIEIDGVATLDFGRGDDEDKQAWGRQAWAGMRRQRGGLVLANPWRVSGLAAVLRRRVRDALQ